MVVAVNTGATGPPARRFCAELAGAWGEPLPGTAGGTRAWLLVEHPGPWGSDPVARGTHPVLAARLRGAVEQGVRVLLVRRHGRYRPRGRWCALAWSGEGGPWMERRRVTDPEELAAVDVEALASGRRPGFGRPDASPVFLVCTHGSKDACCARFGRPAVAALTGRVRGHVWESTHVGGDRFAANLVCLPHGLYFGRLDPQGCLRAARAYAAGRLDLDHYRGRSGLPSPVQAAEGHVRRREGLTGLADLAPRGWREVAAGVVQVELAGQAHRYRATVRRGPAGPPRPRGCGQDCPWVPETWRMVRLERVPLPARLPEADAQLGHGPA